MLLTVDELRAFVTTSLDDDSLTLLLDAAEAAITESRGPLVDPAVAEEWHYPSGPLVFLFRRAGTIASITEIDTALDEDDYRVRPGEAIIERLDTGPNPAARWCGRVKVVFEPLVGELTTRQRVQSELVRTAIDYDGGLASQSIGPWSESYATGKPYAQQWAEILATAGPVFAGIR